MDLSGTWVANDGSLFYARQIGLKLWLAGLSVESPLGANDIQPGLRYSTVFAGTISGNLAGNAPGNIVTGTWSDVPRGQRLGGGTLTLAVTNSLMQVQSVTGEFGPVSWQRTPPASPAPDIFDTFDRVKKNQKAIEDHSLLDNLKPAKTKPVSVFGTVATSNANGIVFAYPFDELRRYNDFICLDNNNSPPDGDMDFDLLVDRHSLDAQVGFWSDAGWEISHGVNPSNFQAKLNYQNANHLHIESIMFGGTTECGDSGQPSFLLPGWEQKGAIGVLFNGRPIGGQIQLSALSDQSSRLVTVLGRTIPIGSRLHITGILALDCGHGWTRPCNEDDPTFQNQEIHPVFSLDLVQDFRIPRPLATLTGVWAANDGGNYYVTQVGSTVWWLGMSADAGRTFANVFQGTIDNTGAVSGPWADVPLGQTANAGTINVQGTSGPTSTALRVTNKSGGFGGSTWEKLYDAGGNNVGTNR